jgi:microcystin-dependent protein
MNFLNKMNFTCIVIIIIIAMATLHLYNIKNVDKFEDIAVEDNQIVSADVNILIPSMNQVVFNGEQLNTIMDKKVSKTELNDVMPELSVISYAGSTAPTGWQLCNGTALKYTNGYFVSNTDERTSSFNKNPTGDLILTPDLKGKFILGNGGTGDNKALHNNGGEETHTLTVDEMPEHNHTHKDRIHVEPHANGNGFNYAYTRLGFEHLDYTGDPRSGANGDWQHWGNWGRRKIWGKNDITGNVGDNTPHNNMPPYYVLTYIIKQPSLSS